MKISACYSYPIARHGYLADLKAVLKSFRELRAMGYRNAEMEAIGVANCRKLHGLRKDIRRQCDAIGLHVHNFAIMNPDLVSLCRPRRRKAYEMFERGVEVAHELDSETVHVATYPPPVVFEKAPYRIARSYGFDLNYRVRIPRGFSYETAWDALVDSIRTCAGIAAKAGMTLIAEPRAGEMICNSDSMLRLIRDVGSKYFRANFDCAHFQTQKEFVPVAQEKLKGLYANVHVADNDSCTVEHLPFGKGVIPWDEVLRNFHRHGYHGYLGVDIFGPTATMPAVYRRSLQWLIAAGKRLRIPITA